MVTEIQDRKDQENPGRAAEAGASSLEQASEPAGVNGKENPEAPITRIGSYKVVKPIGEGVAGHVFQAEQQEPVRLMVSLKVIKDSMDWRQIVARFEAEQQTLSRMDHPNIVKLLGTGTRQSGQPYFVAEWVDGVPITKYCDDHQLSVRQRLELFVPVCQAVQYAHQKGVLHGDLKPSNVLVAGSEGKETAPKILDFGVAKATRRNPSESTSSPDPGGPSGKPEYLSPEQADANVPDIDTRSDVYSLGVLLYELLTGTTPLTRERLKDASITEAMRAIREEEIPPPSKRLDESKDEVASIAAKRDMKPAALVKTVRGELDCLVMKALEKDRTRRYETVNGLARDLQRYLAHEPVEACPSSNKYQLGRMARKHPRALAVTAVVLFLLLAIGVAGAGVAVWALRKEGQARKAEQEAVEKEKKEKKAAAESKGELHLSEEARKATAKERDRAKAAEKTAQRSEEDTKAVLAFLKDKLFSAGHPANVSLTDAFWAKGQDKDVTLRQAVDVAASRVAEAFADRPLGEATIRQMLGSAYLKLGEAALAVKQYERALALRTAMLGVNDPDTAECRNKLAIAYRLARRPDEAGRLFNHDYDSPARASALAVDGSVLLSQKKPTEAELKLRECLAIRQKVQPNDWTTFNAKSLLGEALLDQKKYVDAEPLLLSGYKGMKQHEDKIPSQDKGRLIKTLERLIHLYEAWGKKDEAAKWWKELEAMKASKNP
ncbi:MAG TPA: serine/threonine-protein kinase [Gemmataceae bacterium]|nr:serine/threonine-protein kinase [Gemmataceae bacterium]